MIPNAPCLVIDVRELFLEHSSDRRAPVKQHVIDDSSVACRIAQPD
jgi:hypothetical protein